MKWDVKYDNILRIVLVTAGVYLTFRYLLPLILPFVIAFLIAVLIRPVVRWLHSRLRIPTGIAAIFSLGSLLTGIVWGICSFGRILVRQITDLSKHFPVWRDWCSGCLERVCGRIEKGIALEPGLLASRTRQLISDAGEMLSQEGVSYAVENSGEIFSGIINFGIITIIIFIASVLYLTGEARREKVWQQLPFRKELEVLKNRLSDLGKTYVRCELLAIILTCLICVTGLWIIGNPYFLLIGIGIGVLDALPLFGTGTVLIPWAIYYFVAGDVRWGIVLILTYAVGYAAHQFLESRMLGESMGVTPLMALAALYTGVKLFGLSGLILGPVGLTLIREILSIWDWDTTSKHPGRNL